jgi:hypothetical protein
MRKFLFLIFITITFFSFDKELTLSGKWEFKGGTYNSKTNQAPKDFTLEKFYFEKEFTTYMLVKSLYPVIYEMGTYKLKGDTCFETLTYRAQLSKPYGIAIRYLYTIRNDTLILKTKLPDGTIEEDYWKRIPDAPPPY